jgi:hypothetical protein
MIVPRVASLIAGLLFSTTTFSQDEIQVDISPNKLAGDIKMLIPNGEYFIFEQYHYFKHNYWVGFTDTLTRLESGALKGKKVMVDPLTFSTKLDKCDSIINKIRNSALDHKLFFELSNMARREIGYVHGEFTSLANGEWPTERQTVQLCHDEFKLRIEKWYNVQTEKIRMVKSQKKERLQEIKSQSDITVSKAFIKDFLTDYKPCEIDQAAILELMKSQPDNFLTVCEELSDMDFFDLKLNISMLSDTLSTNEVVAKFQDSSIRTARTRKLVRKLKKNVR